MPDFRVSVITELVSDHVVEADTWEEAREIAEQFASSRFTSMDAYVESVQAEDECD